MNSLNGAEMTPLHPRAEMPLPCPACGTRISFEAEIELVEAGTLPASAVACRCCGCRGPVGRGRIWKDFEGSRVMAVTRWNEMPRRPAEHVVLDDLAPVPVLIPADLRDDSWLQEPRFEWFRRALHYAATQQRAIPALARVPPEDLYFATAAIMRGAGIPEPVPVEPIPAAP